MTLPFNSDKNSTELDFSVRIVSGFKGDVSKFRTSRDESAAVDTPHAHDFIQMWYGISGTYKHGFAEREYILGKGSLLVVPPFYTHYLDTSISEDSALYRCEFSEEFIDDMQDSEQRESLFNLVYLEPVLSMANLITPYHYYEGRAAAEIESILGELCEEYYKRDIFSSMFIRANIIKLLAVIVRERQISMPKERNEVFHNYRTAIQSTLEYIHQNYTKKLYVNQVCKIALMSERSFSYIFKRLTGKTLMEYVLHLRVLRARELLAETDRKQADIAKECGFIDVSYFNRTFKRLMGSLPGQYRNCDALTDEPE